MAKALSFNADVRVVINEPTRSVIVSLFGQGDNIVQLIVNEWTKGAGISLTAEQARVVAKALTDAADTASPLVAPAPPRCARCGEVVDHQCNSAYCSLDCDDADAAEGKDRNGVVLEFPGLTA